MASVFTQDADGAFTCHSVGLAAAKCYFIGILGGIGMLYFQDLMPGQAVQPPRSIPTLRAWAGSSQDRGGHRRRDLELSRCVLVCDGMIIATLFCLLRIKDV